MRLTNKVQHFVVFVAEEISPSAHKAVGDHAVIVVQIRIRVRLRSQRGGSCLSWIIRFARAIRHRPRQSVLNVRLCGGECVVRSINPVSEWLKLVGGESSLPKV